MPGDQSPEAEPAELSREIIPILVAVTNRPLAILALSSLVLLRVVGGQDLKPQSPGVPVL